MFASLGKVISTKALFFFFAENNSYSRVLFFGFDEAVKVIDIHLHLTEVLVGQLANLQIDEDVATQKSIVENQVDEEMFFVKSEALLTGLNQEPLSKFEKEALNMGDDGGLLV